MREKVTERVPCPTCGSIIAGEVFETSVIHQVRKEISQEKFRQAVEYEKERLRRKRGMWNRIFPWKIVITRR